MKKLILMAGISCFFFAACKKDDKGGKTLSRSEMLEQGKWQLTAMTLNYGVGDMDLLSSFDPCRKDNLYLFNPDKTITADEGASKCDPSAAQTTTDGNWALTAGDTKIQLSASSLTAGYGNVEGDIIKLDTTTLQVRKDTTITFPGAPAFGGTVKLTLTNTR